MPPFTFLPAFYRPEPAPLPPEALAKVDSILAFRARPVDPRELAPADLRELAMRAADLADAIRAVHNRLAGTPDAIRRTGHRLADAAGSVHRVRADLLDTARDLAWLRGPPRCRADWGCCPRHGNTLITVGGQSRCQLPHCGSSWSYDCEALPCAEPAAYAVGDRQGQETRLCIGHSISAREQLIGATRTPLTTRADHV